jgi:hypothetical protein
VDAATAQNSGAQMGSFVVFLGDSKKLADPIKSLAQKENIQHTILSVMDNTADIADYDIARDADVTVVLYRNRLVFRNHAFKKGDLSEKDTAKIVSEISELVKQ